MKKAVAPKGHRLCSRSESAANDRLELQLHATVLLLAFRRGVGRDGARFTRTKGHDALAVHTLRLQVRAHGIRTVQRQLLVVLVGAVTVGVTFDIDRGLVEFLE